MRTFCDVLADALHRGPPERLERLTPWIVALLGTGMVAMIAYCWYTAWYR